MLDIHSHVLPGIDDGAKTLADAIEMLKGLKALGFTDVFATPHFYPGRYLPSHEAVCTAKKDVDERLDAENIDLNLHLGRECFLDTEIFTHPDAEHLSFAWQGQRYLLLELNPLDQPLAAVAMAKRLIKQGIHPILAHVERYRSILKKPKAISLYQDAGFIIQVDVRNLSPNAPSKMQKTIHALLDLDGVDAMASDIHRPSQLKDLELGMAALEKCVGQASSDRFYSPAIRNRACVLAS